MSVSADTSLGFDDFPSLIRIRRLAMGLSQEQFGRRVDVSVTAVSSWERGERTPKAGLIPDLASAMKLDPELIARLIVGNQRS